MKKLKSLKLSASLVLALIIGVLALGSRVVASNGFWGDIKHEIAQIVAGRISTPPQENSDEDANIGAATGPDLPNPHCFAGSCSKTVVGTFIDASTTIVSIPSPFVRATSTGAGQEVVLYTDGSGQAWTSQTTTVELVNLNITGAATTSYRLACGAYTNSAGVLPLTRTIVSTTPALAGDSIPTSTKGVLENNVSVAQGAAYAVGTVGKIMLGSDAPYLVCTVDPVVAAGFTNGNNTFDGKYTVRFRALAR